MLVRDVMSSPVVAVAPDTSLREAARLLDRHAVTVLPVLDGDEHLVGVISEADVVREALLVDPRAHEIPVHAPTDDRPDTVAEVMNRQVLSIPPQADLAEAADLLTSTAVKSLPVVDHGRVVGMVSRRDIVAVLARRDERVRAEVDELFRVSNESWTVDVQDGVVVVDGPATDHEQELALILASTVAGVVGLRFRSDMALRPPHETGWARKFPPLD